LEKTDAVLQKTLTEMPQTDQDPKTWQIYVDGIRESNKRRPALHDEFKTL
jgi:hypothetical protein